MSQSIATDGVRQLDLLDSLNGEWLKLLLLAVREVGPAAQTLGGLLKLTAKQTFASANTIAASARVPVATCRKHLVTLHEAGLIRNVGRERTRRGAPRRTCTIRITKKTADALQNYVPLPWWSCCMIGKVNGKRWNRRLPWSAKLLLGVVLSRLMSIKGGLETEYGQFEDHEDFWGQFEIIGDGRFGLSLNALTAATGLDHKSVVLAKRALKGIGVVEWYRVDGDHKPDSLVPSSDFRVVVTPTTNGFCQLDFDGGRKVVDRGYGKSGQ